MRAILESTDPFRELCTGIVHSPEDCMSKLAGDSATPCSLHKSPETTASAAAVVKEAFNPVGGVTPIDLCAREMASQWVHL